MKNLTFGYTGQSIPVIRNLSLRLQKSDFIGIVGPSGVGKTTFIRTLVQLAMPSSGDITIDGKVLAEPDLRAWQNLFCYIPQDPMILSDSITRNIAFGVEEKLIDVRAVRSILQQIGMNDVVGQLPHGIDSILGERGNDLSGGQKQRLAIGRALYRNAEIFIFDEAFNELDQRSVRELVDLVKSLHRSGKTIIMISHHPRLLSHCRTLYTLSDGRLHEAMQFQYTEVEG